MCLRVRCYWRDGVGRQGARRPHPPPLSHPRAHAHAYINTHTPRTDGFLLFLSSWCSELAAARSPPACPDWSSSAILVGGVVIGNGTWLGGKGCVWVWGGRGQREAGSVRNDLQPARRLAARPPACSPAPSADLWQPHPPPHTVRPRTARTHCMHEQVRVSSTERMVCSSPWRATVLSSTSFWRGGAGVRMGARAGLPPTHPCPSHTLPWTPPPSPGCGCTG